jgi:predicted Zn-dependent protease
MRSRLAVSVIALSLIGTIAGTIGGTIIDVAHAQTPAAEPGGVKVGNPSFLRKLVSAEKLEIAAESQYAQLTRQAFQKGALVQEGNPQLARLRAIAKDLLPHSYKFNERAKDWRWEVNLINSPQINAFCMPGGKIAFFTGILDKLSLTDDEVAMVMGHEIAHALREHARTRAVKSTMSNVGGQLLGTLILGGQFGQQVGAQAGGLLTLKFSRGDETDADLVGMEVAARAGYDPRAGVTLWEKMSGASKGAPPQWLSTHPSGSTRITTIKDHLKEVMPLYERAVVARKSKAN